MKKIRIILITQNYPPKIGGISTYAFNLGQSLKMDGHAVLILNYGSTKNNYKKFKVRDLFYTPATHNIYFNIFNLLNPFHIFKLGGFKDFVYQNMIYRETKIAVQKFKPDLIYLLNAKIYSAVYDLKIPFLLTCHSEEITNTLPIIYSLNKASRIICISHFTANLVKSFVPHLQNKIEVVYTGIDLNKYHGLGYSRKKQLITLCRLDKRKNLANIIKSYSMLPKDILDNYKYIIVGDGSERLSLEKLVNDLKMNEKVQFFGAVDEETKVRLLCESKIFIMCPTNYFGEQEGFGITYIEAQAAGLPTIGSNTGGAPEAIGKGGIYVEDENNTQQITDKIKLLLTNYELYKSLQLEIANRINNFDNKYWFDNILRISEKVIQNN